MVWFFFKVGGPYSIQSSPYVFTAYDVQPLHLLNLDYEQKELLASLLKWRGMSLKEISNVALDGMASSLIDTTSKGAA